MKKDNKGFTLVELLAVIVILGLLMAIAIPSVTKYITQSRVKTLVSSMDSYITAIVTEVNDGGYKFSDSTKVFAIPIECVALEKGGSNPFGNWHQANSAYWAYVLVHYDSTNYNYEYGFTFKDDAGYGLYPTLNSKIENSMVKTGYDDLNQPKNGLAKNFVAINKWDGFSNITDSTQLVVLQSESEGVLGNGEKTCTLQQKGDNYNAVEEEKAEYLRTHCRVTSGTGNTVGDVITCGSEDFYVVESNSTTIKMLAKYNITIDKNNPRQNKNAGQVLFASSAYWGTAEGKAKYGSNYPVYVFDSNSRMYPYVMAYHTYLKENFELDTSTIGLITTQKLDELGCERSNWTCTPYPWLVSEAYWTGSASGPTYVWCAAGNNYFCNYDWSYARGIRPLVTVSKSEIIF